MGDLPISFRTGFAAFRQWRYQSCRPTMVGTMVGRLVAYVAALFHLEGMCLSRIVEKVEFYCLHQAQPHGCRGSDVSVEAFSKGSNGLECIQKTANDLKEPKQQWLYDQTNYVISKESYFNGKRSVLCLGRRSSACHELRKTHEIEDL